MLPDEIDPVIHVLRRDGWFPIIAAKLNIRRQAPYSWRRVPPARVLAIARITRIPCHMLRPDLYPAPRRTFG
jgi:hypothetical protein